MENETLGERIRRLRESRRWTQGQLANAVDSSEKSVSNWETGRNHPRGFMGALREVFGPALDGEEADVDAVVEAIAKSKLTRGNKATLTGTYYDMLDSQDEEVRGA